MRLWDPPASLEDNLRMAACASDGHETEDDAAPEVAALDRPALWLARAGTRGIAISQGRWFAAGFVVCFG